MRNHIRLLTTAVMLALTLVLGAIPARATITAGPVGGKGLPDVGNTFLPAPTTGSSILSEINKLSGFRPLAYALSMDPGTAESPRLRSG